MPTTKATFVPVRFADLDGWADDQHDEALAAFRLSASRSTGVADADVRAVAPGRDAARAFFERHFVPHRVVHDGAAGFLTGYYEPVFDGSMLPTERYPVPVYRRPPDLVNLIAESERGAKADQPSHARRTADGTLEPYATRAEIAAGALAGRGLEQLYLADPIDLFFMQVQGSGRIRLPDGRLIRVTYDGKNGHPYTSIGRALVDSGTIAASDMSLATLRAWLAEDEARARVTMGLNHSYVFFRALDERTEPGPQGVLGTELRPGRSLAVDTGFHALGTPIWVLAPELRHFDGRPFARLMVAQDVGSAIRGPERGDIYFGSGLEAGARAGITKHVGRFVVLLPRRDGAGGGAP